MDRAPQRPLKDILTLWLIELNTYESEHPQRATDALFWIGNKVTIGIVFLLSFFPSIFTLDLLRGPAFSSFFVTVLTFIALEIAYTIGALLTLAGLSLLVYKALDLVGLIGTTGDTGYPDGYTFGFMSQNNLTQLFQNATITDKSINSEIILNDLRKPQTLNTLRTKIKELIMKCDNGVIIDQPLSLIQSVTNNSSSGNVDATIHTINTHIPTFNQSHSLSNN